MRTKLTASLIALTLALSSVGLAVPHVAHAQQRAVDDDHADLLDRIDDVADEVQDAQENGDITRTKASEMRRQLTTIRKSARNVTRQQGFLSAGESASYNRTLDSIENQLPDN